MTTVRRAGGVIGSGARQVGGESESLAAQRQTTHQHHRHALAHPIYPVEKNVDDDAHAAAMFFELLTGFLASHRTES